MSYRNAVWVIVKAIQEKIEDGTIGLDALKDLILAIPTAPELEADAAKRVAALLLAIDGIPTTLPAYGDIKVYPWAADAVLNADPDYSYTAEVSEGGTDYVEVGHFDFDEDKADIKGIFVNLVWGQKIYGLGFGLVKWQMASGSNASPGAYADITDEVSENLSSYSDHGRSGVVHKITGVPSQTPFTIRCVVKNVDAISAQAKIKSNSYIRVAYKRVS